MRTFMTACAVALMETLVRSWAGAGEVRMALEPFDQRVVQLLDGPCKTAMDTNRRYLLELDPDRLLYNFRVNAGLPAPGTPLGGWEAPDVEVRGHFTGHYLSACSLMYRATGDPLLKRRVDLLVAELAKCQKALGGEYLSAFPSSFWDRLESGRQIPWAPYYTIHKIMAGLFDAYALCGNHQALEVLKGMAAYFKKRTDRLPIADMDRVLNTEFGGMSEVLHNLYSVTKDPAHLELAHRFDQAAFLGPLGLDHDDLSRIHANTQIPKICGAARRYEVTGDARYRHIVSYFWDRVVNHRTYATGGCTNGEAWGDPDHLADSLSATNQECCTTYNMLKVTRYLLRWTGAVRYGDFYERAFFNGILGTQEPGTGMLMYYVPLASGFRRPFGTPFNSFWCCYGTGIESFSKLNDSIYFHSGNSLYVNLFIASKVAWAEKGVVLEQHTRFPEEDRTEILVRADHPARFDLRIRIPGWVAGPVKAVVNGAPAGSVAAPGTILTLRRLWHNGDRVECRLPMKLHSAPMPDDANMVAVMMGPIVLAGVLPSTQPGVALEYNPVSAPASPGAFPEYLVGDPSSVQDWLEAVPNRPLTYRLKSRPDIVLEPFYKVVHEPYAVYWLVLPEGSPRLARIHQQEEARRRMESRIVDRVVPNDARSEAAHNLRGEHTAAGPFGRRGWRHAAPDGWFSWDLAVLPNVPMTLLCTYWGSDVGPRTFDILVDGQRVATQSVDRNHPGEFFDVLVPIPDELTRGKKKITVLFRPHPGNTAGGVFGCATLRPEGEAR
ncbi:MAG: beta-L-arabinofuranosidase domain-containing protein [Chthonomonadales bacterium]